MPSIDTPAGFSAAFERHRGRTDDGAKMLGHMGAEQFEVEQTRAIPEVAAEEASLHFAESAESKHVAERKKELARPRSLMSSQAIESYIEDTEDDGEEEEGSSKLLVLVQRVMSGQGDPALHARHLFSRPTSQYLGLQYALQHGEREGASDQLLEGLREALDDLEMECGPRIRADINIVEVAKEGAKTRSDVVGFQSTYVDVVLGQTALAGWLKLMLDKFGESGLEAGMERFRRALGMDMESGDPSKDIAHLENLIRDLSHLSVAGTVLEGCRQLQADILRWHGIGDGVQPVALMKDLVNLSSETWLSSDRFARLAEDAGASALEARINFLTGVKGLLNAMPTKIFVDMDQRQSVLSAAQHALDEAINLEDA